MHMYASTYISSPRQSSIRVESFSEGMSLDVSREEMDAVFHAARQEVAKQPAPQFLRPVNAAAFQIFLNYNTYICTTCLMESS